VIEPGICEGEGCKASGHYRCLDTGRFLCADCYTEGWGTTAHKYTAPPAPDMPRQLDLLADPAPG